MGFNSTRMKERYVDLIHRIDDGHILNFVEYVNELPIALRAISQEDGLLQVGDLRAKLRKTFHLWNQQTMRHIQKFLRSIERSCPRAESHFKVAAFDCVHHIPAYAMQIFKFQAEEDFKGRHDNAFRGLLRSLLVRAQG